MSSMMNHRKRSRYSESKKAGAYKAQSRQAYYRTAYDDHNHSFLYRLFHRRAPRQAEIKREQGVEE